MNFRLKAAAAAFWQPVYCLVRLCRATQRRRRRSTARRPPSPRAPRLRADSIAAAGYGGTDRRPEVRSGRQGRATEAGAAGSGRRAGRGSTRRSRRQQPRQQAVTDNAAAVTTLQSDRDRPEGQSRPRWRHRFRTRRRRSRRISPIRRRLHYKGITLTPGGFIAGETVYRTQGDGRRHSDGLHRHSVRARATPTHLSEFLRQRPAVAREPDG